MEIYISQGAKPGLGGQLMAKKVTKELAAVRGIPEGIDLRSPSRHPDIMGADDLVIKVEEFREATGYNKPISIKMGAGRVRDDIKIAYKDGFDFVQLDGLQGSTGAASTEVLENVGIPDSRRLAGGAGRLARDRRQGRHAHRADGRDQGWRRRGQGARARRQRRRHGHGGDHRRAAASPACNAMSAIAWSASPPRTPNMRRATRSMLQAEAIGRFLEVGALADRGFDQGARP